MDSVEHFWSEWFGSSRETLRFKEVDRGEAEEMKKRGLSIYKAKDGRLFLVSRPVLKTLDELIEVIRFNEVNKLPVYLTVQPYEDEDKPSHIERLFFEFDDKEDPDRAVKDAFNFTRILKRFYHAEPLLALSGCKGAHVYLFLKGPVSIDGLEQEAKETYRRLQEKLLKGVPLQTLDVHVIGNIKQLARVPYTVHEETGRLCQPIDLQGNPIEPEDVDLGFYRENGLDVELLGKSFREVIEEANKRKKRTPMPIKGLRKEIQQLIDMAHNGIDLSHEERLAILFEMLNAGYADDNIHAVFMKQPDYDYAKTQYFIDHARRRGYKPFRGERLKKILKMHGGVG